MTIGTGTFIPAAKFRFPRSYIYQIDIARYGDTITQIANRFEIHAPAPDLTVAVIIIDPAWFLWNSNYRTLDYVVTDFFALVNGVPPQVPLNYTLGWWENPVTHVPGLFFNWYSGFRDPQIFTLPRQPLNYWLPYPLS